MGRSIPSFRMLIDIERSEWIDFKKELCKEDKQRFDRLFSVPKLYCHALSNLSNPITIEPIILSLIFNNFKIFNKIVHGSMTTSVEVENDSIKEGGFQICQSIKESEIEIQIGFNKIIQDWNKFIDCLNEDDEFIFMKMIGDCYNSYHKSINQSFKANSDSCYSRHFAFIMALILYQQKQIDSVKSIQRLFN
ncbi:MAG: hypothetical protein M3Q77_08590 [Thermoproteota archaeon]|nr:hypothetical protein [Nitrosopumilus sp.]MDQ3084853.1 hypothetical protein [Thermoproteota archaeon]